MDYSHKKFMRRLEILKDREGIKTWEEFERRYDMRGSITRWKKGGDVPKSESLLKIAEAFNVSVNWLLSQTNAELGKNTSRKHINPDAPPCPRPPRRSSPELWLMSKKPPQIDQSGIRRTGQIAFEVLS
jgi:transcriptional regulator with XRE-family HTH domain